MRVQDSSLCLRGAKASNKVNCSTPGGISTTSLSLMPRSFHPSTLQKKVQRGKWSPHTLTSCIGDGAVKLPDNGVGHRELDLNSVASLPIECFVLSFSTFEAN